MHDDNEKDMLFHEAEEGYPRIFIIAVIVAVAYMGWIILKNLF